MEVAAVLLTGIMLVLLIGTGKRFKLIAGGIVLATGLTFLVGEMVMKLQTDYYSLGKLEWRNQGHAETLGEWVVPFFFIGIMMLLILLNIRCIMQYKKQTEGARWVWIALLIVMDLLAVVIVPLLFFFVAFMFFPFAP
ncbi:hypothetical protein [Bacillus sp. Marseille-Q1617]|uniref:hypothetical protein n=1 Tax=Bacillus sp. Marseille-Q1617 TaxID=2736887 RepID=UPI001588FAD6|nr:hypothetical protein [Bacillus sp. Marseille-Q1617]